MLFNSYAFMFVFLPVSLVLYVALGRIARGAAMAFLAAASLFFYGWWNPRYLLLLIASNCIHHEQNTNASCGPNRNVSLLCVAVLLVASVDDIRIIEDQGCGLETHPVFANIRLILLGIPFKFNSGKRGSKTNKL